MHYFLMRCKITAIFLLREMFVMIRHSFCGKVEYSDEMFVFVTNGICMLFCHF